MFDVIIQNVKIGEKKLYSNIKGCAKKNGTKVQNKQVL